MDSRLAARQADYYLGGKIAYIPTVLIEGYKFRFYSSDINEPPHVHVIRGESVTKIWLVPVSVEYNRGYNQPELNRIIRLALKNQEKLLEKATPEQRAKWKIEPGGFAIYWEDLDDGIEISHLLSMQALG